MKNSATQNHPRVLSIAPSSRGFGFAVMEGDGRLLDWGIKSVKSDKNTRCVAKAKEIIAHYQPAALVLEIQTSRRAARIRALNKLLAKVADRHEIKVWWISRDRIHQALVVGEKGTKYRLAEILARRFPQELVGRLPPKRRPWMSEDYRMGIFDAVALGLVLLLLKEQRTN